MGGDGHEYYIRMLKLGWVTVKKLFSRELWVLVKVLIGYGSNENKLRLWEMWIGWFAILIVSTFIRPAILHFSTLNNKKSVILSPVFSFHISTKKEYIKTIPRLFSKSHKTPLLIGSLPQPVLTKWLS